MGRKLTHGNKLVLVKNEEKYYSFILNLRNNPEVKTGFINQEHIDLQSHFTFMNKYGSMYYICLLDGEPAGFVGQIKNDIRDGKYFAFTGPLKDNTGKLQLKDGEVASDAHLNSMMYYVEGIDATVPD